MDQAIKEKANKNTQTPSGTIVQLQWYATLLLQTTDEFFFFFFLILGEMVIFYNTDNQHRPGRIE